MGKIYVVGIGPGKEEMLTAQAREALRSCDVIAGYKTYISLVRDRYPEKDIYENGMRGEEERCRRCLSMAMSGKKVALICSGDAGIYGMAALMLEVAAEEGFTDVEIIPGITAASSGAAILGAPVNHDFCVISLSDLLTPWQQIERRLRCAAEGDFVIVIYNPCSRGRAEHLRRACEILREILPADRIAGFAKNVGREGETRGICSLAKLPEQEIDMFTTVFIGNSETKAVDGRMITPRGYGDPIRRSK